VLGRTPPLAWNVAGHHRKRAAARGEKN
jgi:hypothetical protein